MRAKKESNIEIPKIFEELTAQKETLIKEIRELKQQIKALKKGGKPREGLLRQAQSKKNALVQVKQQIKNLKIQKDSLSQSAALFKTTKAQLKASMSESEKRISALKTAKKPSETESTQDALETANKILKETDSLTKPAAGVETQNAPKSDNVILEENDLIKALQIHYGFLNSAFRSPEFQKWLGGAGKNYRKTIEKFSRDFSSLLISQNLDPHQFTGELLRASLKIHSDLRGKGLKTILNNHPEIRGFLRENFSQLIPIANVWAQRFQQQSDLFDQQEKKSTLALIHKTDESHFKNMYNLANLVKQYGVANVISAITETTRIAPKDEIYIDSLKKFLTENPVTSADFKENVFQFLIQQDLTDQEIKEKRISLRYNPIINFFVVTSSPIFQKTVEAKKPQREAAIKALENEFEEIKHEDNGVHSDETTQQIEEKQPTQLARKSEIPELFKENQVSKNQFSLIDSFKNWINKKKTSENRSRFFKAEKPIPLHTVTKKFELASRQQFDITAIVNENKIQRYKYRIEGDALKDNRQKNLLEFVFRAQLSGQFNNGMKLTGSLAAVKETINALHEILPNYDKPIMVTIKQNEKTETFSLKFQRETNWNKLKMSDPGNTPLDPNAQGLLTTIKANIYPEHGSLAEQFVSEVTQAAIPQLGK